MSVGLGSDRGKLRDYFAGQVASGVIAACRGDTTNEGETTEQMLVRKVWAFADAMLEARQ